MPVRFTLFTTMVALGLLAVPTYAADCKQGDGSLAATYELRGVMEVGSAIRLHRDGRFEYMMTYGAADEVAEGCWKRAGETVVLTTSRMRNNHGGRKFKQLKLKLNSSGGLVRTFDATHKGTYARLR